MAGLKILDIIGLRDYDTRIKKMIESLRSSIEGKADKSELTSKADKTHTHTMANVDGLETALSGKAAQSSLDSHTGDKVVHITASERTKWNTASTHAGTAHAPSDAEPNQNAFSNVKVGTTTVAADAKQDTIEFVGSNVTLTPDATNDKVTIGITKTNVTNALGYTPIEKAYTHPTTSGNKHIPAGGASGQILGWSADGTAKWQTAPVSGVSSVNKKTGAVELTAEDVGADPKGAASDAIKSLVGAAPETLDTIHEIADAITENNGAIDAINNAITNKADKGHTHTIANVTGLQDVLDNKAASEHGTHVAYSTVAPVAPGTASAGTAPSVARSDHKHPVQTSVSGNAGTATKLGTPRKISLAGDASGSTTFDGSADVSITVAVADDSHNHVISNIDGLQTALDSKSNDGHTHSYAGSTTAGGAATSANKLNTNAGSVTQPVYFSNGVPVNTTYTLAKSVPSNAVFTDTNTWIAFKGATTAAAGTAGYAPAPAAGAANRYLRSDGTWTVPPDTNTTYADLKGATTSAAGTHGLVPAPAAGAATRYLRSDGQWVVPPDNNTTYTAGTGITLSGTQFINAGVRSVATGTTNGTVAVNTNGTTTQVAVKGLGTAAYTASTAYAAASHNHSAANITSGTLAVARGGTGNSVGEVVVSASQPTETGVKIWIQPNQ